MRTPLVFLGLLFTAFLAGSLAFGHHPLPKGVVLRVVIIRHGEKPDTGDNLSCAGLNRALALPPVLNQYVGTPDYTYVPAINTGKKTTSVRMFQTVTPFAVLKNLTLDSKYAETDTKDAAEDVRMRSGVVLMVWEHKNIPPLAQHLKAPNVPKKWDSTDFDSIWIIDYTDRDSDGKAKSATLDTSNNENIHPSPNCPPSFMTKQ